MATQRQISDYVTLLRHSVSKFIEAISDYKQIERNYEALDLATNLTTDTLVGENEGLSIACINSSKKLFDEMSEDIDNGKYDCFLSIR